jgi:hypothetical protein
MSGHVGFVVNKVALGQIFSKYFGFPSQLSLHLLLHIHHLASGAGTVGQIVTYVPSGVSHTPPQETKKNNKLVYKDCAMELDSPLVCCCENLNEPSASIKGTTFLD